MNEKIYNIKIYNDEFDLIVNVLNEKIKKLRIKAEEEQDEMQKVFIKADIQKYQNLVIRLETGAIYNDENFGIDTLYNEIEKNV